MRRIRFYWLLVIVFTICFVSDAFGDILQTYSPHKVASKGHSKDIGSREDISKRTENSTEWITTIRENGKVRKGRYTQLSPGLFYNAGSVDHPDFKKPDTRIILSADGGVVKNIGQPIRFAPVLDANEPVIEQTAESSPILSATPSFIIYRDTQTDRTVRLAEQRPGAELAVKGNVATFANAFSGLRADLRYTVDPAQVEQDVLLFEKPLPPSAYGLSDDTTRFVVLTRLFHINEHFKESTQTVTETGAVQGWAPRSPQSVLPPGGEIRINREVVATGNSNFDSLTTVPTTEPVDFMRNGKIVQRFARSYALDGKEKYPVEKRIVTIQGMYFLAEEVPAKLILERELPQASMDMVQAPMLFDSFDALASFKTSPEEVGQVAQLSPSDQHILQAAPTANGVGIEPFIMDFISVTGVHSNGYTFQQHQTYLVSGRVVIFGDVFFEGGAIIKFEDDGTLELTEAGNAQMPINSEADSSQWTVFTSKNDDTVGETITGSTGTPTYYDAAIEVSGGTIRNAKFSWAKEAVRYFGLNNTLTIKDSLFILNQDAVKATTDYGTAVLNLENLFMTLNYKDVDLDDSAGNALTVTASNLTLAGTFVHGFNSALAHTGSSLSITDSLFVNLANDSFFNGAQPGTQHHNGFCCSATQPPGMGNVYLTTSPIVDTLYLDQNSGIVDAGSRLAKDAGLFFHRTAPPTDPNGMVEALTTVDIGFHMPPRITDFAVFATNSIWMQSDASFTGHVGVNNASSSATLGTSDLVISSGVTVDASHIIVADTIHVEEGATVDGKVYHKSGLINDGTIDPADIFTPAELPILQTLPKFREAVGVTTNDILVTVAEGTETITMGNYGELKAEADTKLILESGLYNVKNIVLEENAQLLANGPVDIRVEGAVDASAIGTVIGPNAGANLSANGILIYSALDPLQDPAVPVINFGEESLVAGVFYAKNGILRLGPRAHGEGLFIAKDVLMESESTVVSNYDDPFIVSPVSFTPGEGTVQPGDTIALSTLPSAASIFYTTDGTDPATTAGGSTLAYTDPIPIDASQGPITVKAIATLPGWTDSDVSSATYTLAPAFTVADVIFSPEGGEIQLTDDVVLFSLTFGSSIFYTVDGSDPATTAGGATFLYTAPFSVDVSQGSVTVKAIATQTGWFDSNITSATFDLAPNEPPLINITSPQNGSLVIVNQPTIGVNYSDVSGIDTATLALQLDGQPLSATCTTNSTAATCSLDANIPDGSATITATIADQQGLTANDSVTFLVDGVPINVEITDPIDGLITTEEGLFVSGTVDPQPESLTVNGVATTITGNAWVTSDLVPLREGLNMLVAVAHNANNKAGVGAVDITRDIQKPIVRINMPRNGLVSAEDRITVTGVVNDIVSGGLEPTVTVNGKVVEANNGTFIATDVQLVRGPNTIEVIATDEAGNVSNPHSIAVTYKKPVGPRMKLFSGDLQLAEVGSTLPQPLVAQIVDELGNPVTGHMVKFEVTRNNGTVSAVGNGITASPRIVAVPTDGSGRAQVNFTLGDRSGVGNNRVRATSVGVAGEVEFCAAGDSGPVIQIVSSDGSVQRGVVGEPLPIPLEALAVDEKGNPVAGENVIFEVVAGGGNLEGDTMFTKATGIDGRARAVFSLGMDEGVNNNVVVARFTGQVGQGALFTASGIKPGNPEDTTFSGLVQDAGQGAIPNATVLIEETDVSTTTDAEGKFLLTNVPVGAFVLKVDPTASTRTETFPPLEFEIVTIPGVENSLGRPVILPEIDTDMAKLVGGPLDVELEMKGVPGVKMTVFANSVTFPDDSTTDMASLSQVHFDQVPMEPPNGSLPPLAGTLQPLGAKYDPPIRVQLPNNDGFAPGSIIEIFQFHHDTSRFVPVGKATVTEDGQFVITDEGFGLPTGGWHLFPPPPPPTQCGASCNDNNRCTVNEKCVEGGCTRTKLSISQTIENGCAGCDNGIPLNPLKNAECCRRAKVPGAGGWVVCCNGKLTPCVNHSGTKQSDEIIRTCLKLHEVNHFSDVFPCPTPGASSECGATINSNWKPGRYPKAECDRAKEEISCLNNFPQCQGFCLLELIQRIDTVMQDANSPEKVPGCFP